MCLCMWLDKWDNCGWWMRLQWRLELTRFEWFFSHILFILGETPRFSSSVPSSGFSSSDMTCVLLNYIYRIKYSLSNAFFWRSRRWDASRCHGVTLPRRQRWGTRRRLHTDLPHARQHYCPLTFTTSLQDYSVKKPEFLRVEAKFNQM